MTTECERIRQAFRDGVRCVLSRGATRRDDVFVPPPLVRKLALKGRASVKGVAVLKMDATKNRKGWAAETLQRV